MMTANAMTMSETTTGRSRSAACKGIMEPALDLGFSGHADSGNAFGTHFGIAPSISRDRAL